MTTVAIVAGGPFDALADLRKYEREVDVWIGADLGATYITQNHLRLALAIGDFDSITKEDISRVEHEAERIEKYPMEKDETDLELAIQAGLSYQPTRLFLFGITGGRLDHELANIQLLYRLLMKGIEPVLVDHLNQLTIHQPGIHHVRKSAYDQKFSFLPFTETVKNLSLEGFYYPLVNQTIHWGTTLCISNQLIAETGTFSFHDGILIMIKSL
ncbi:hypothetical protein J416_01034 [Gracilibacillus halophilus YIM-C55.5]|uniref:Thiamine diphosphokinase n=1 Tax=Gracilibacillus halophilus YIM-C55.5 TaxID=1308866 RepID=N4WV80_9BACI|nr:thiamine diphosphokinase [Gracilibacillus halophilus]ENH98280.1 hypothetical protein J416_01034 [Gracilibacillus halophilus YIM-C55.5]